MNFETAYMYRSNALHCSFCLTHVETQDSLHVVRKYLSN
uniref:Uncharacterized protein n=1 Tax=Anguilla anguilla TaxID=7936 RepID=A0A0E9QQT4_ANGAN